MSAENSEEAVNDFVLFQQKIEKLHDPTENVLGPGCLLLLLWAIVFCIASVSLGFQGSIFSAILWSGVYFSIASMGMLVTTFIFSSGKNHWLSLQVGISLTFIALAVFIALNYEGFDLTYNLVFHGGLMLASWWGSYTSVVGKTKELHQQRFSAELVSIFEAYKAEDFAPEVLAMLNTAIRDRIDIHHQVCVVRKGDPLVQQARLLEQADASLCLLIEQGVPLSRLLERKEALIAEKKIDSSIGDTLYEQLQPAMHQFKQKAESLHELAITVLGLKHEEVPENMERLAQRQKQVSLINKTVKDVNSETNE